VSVLGWPSPHYMGRMVSVTIFSNFCSSDPDHWIIVKFGTAKPRLLLYYSIQKSFPITWSSLQDLQESDPFVAKSQVFALHRPLATKRYKLPRNLLWITIGNVDTISHMTKIFLAEAHKMGDTGLFRMFWSMFVDSRANIEIAIYLHYYEVQGHNFFTVNR
jgi:hypothetical protein